jgi:outer membrane protein OmpA-like peptidoglycan-associated protein
VIFTGRVLSDNDESPLGAKVSCNSTFETESELIHTDPENGSFTFTVPVGQKISLSASAAGYFPVELEEDLSRFDKYTVLRRDIYLKPLAVGQTIQLRNLFFVQSKAELLPESLPELEGLYTLLIEKPTLAVELGGHTDNQGLAAANVRLSKQRADAVRDYLIKQGIAGNRLKAVGYGPKYPIANNQVPESRKLNRRVEIKILKF